MNALSMLIPVGWIADKSPVVSVGKSVSEGPKAAQEHLGFEEIFGFGLPSATMCTKHMFGKIAQNMRSTFTG